MEAHDRIVEALAARDGAAARAAVTDDIMQAADSLARLLVKSDRSRSSVPGVKKA
jgi:DNA-binding GntR family transcriptional regulator